jgi:hypothetical protein
MEPGPDTVAGLSLPPGSAVNVAGSTTWSAPLVVAEPGGVDAGVDLAPAPCEAAVVEARVGAFLPQPESERSPADTPRTSALRLKKMPEMSINVAGDVPMTPAKAQGTKWLEYDALHRRVWIGGQRLHHGATGMLVATTACAGLISGHTRALGRLMAMAAAGGALMAHDWKDRSVWFQLGRGQQL